MQRTVEQRFWEKIKWGNPFGCWEWMGGKNKNPDFPYGIFWVPNKNSNGKNSNSLAHRASYELFIGKIPEGLTIDHLCRNPLCVNPHHLEPVTLRENILRGVSISASCAKKTHCPKGHLLEIDRWNPNRRTCRECKKEHDRRYNRTRNN